MKLFPIFKKVVSGGGAFIASTIEAGIEFANRFSLTVSEVNIGVEMDLSPMSAQINQIPAVDTELLGAVGTASFPGHTPAVDVDSSLRDVVATGSTQIPAVAVAQSLNAVMPASFLQTPAVDTDLLGVVGTLKNEIQIPSMDIDLLGATGTLKNELHTPAVDTDLLGATGTLKNEVHTPATDIDLLGAIGTSNNEIHTPAVGCSARISEFHVDEVPACELVQVTYNLNRRVGSNAAANTGADPWTNPNNANGIHDGSNAESLGELLAARTRALQLDYANHLAESGLFGEEHELLLIVESLYDLAVAGSAMTLVAGAISSATFAANSITAAAVAADAIVGITDGVWSKVIIANLTTNEAAGALNLLRQMVTNQLEEQSGTPGTMRLYLDDASTVRLSWQLRAESSDTVNEAINAPARRAPST